jgi:hypothetical protein
VGNHGDAVLGQEFPDTQGRVTWRIVVVQKPGTGRPFLMPVPTNCISKALQNDYIDSLIHGLTLGKKLVMHQTLRVKGWPACVWIIVDERAAIFKSGIPLKCLGPTQGCFCESLL